MGVSLCPIMTCDRRVLPLESSPTWARKMMQDRDSLGKPGSRLLSSPCRYILGVKTNSRRSEFKLPGAKNLVLRVHSPPTWLRTRANQSLFSSPAFAPQDNIVGISPAQNHSIPLVSTAYTAMASRGKQGGEQFSPNLMVNGRVTVHNERTCEGKGRTQAKHIHQLM